MAQIARDLGIADSTLHHWCKLLSEQGEQAFPGSGHQTPQEEEIRHLKRENDLLRQERDIFKKAIGIFSRGQVRSFSSLLSTVSSTQSRCCARLWMFQSAAIMPGASGK
jgi:transposase